MGLFSKLKDYNAEVEEILDNKVFSTTSKNLLFSMIYRLETSYPDYKEVKRCVRSKEDFLNEIIETLRLYCDNIKIAEPDSDQAKMLIKNNVNALTNERERSILSYPTEIALLYAVSDISPKYFYLSEDLVLKEHFQNSLVNGYNQNNVEILNDFTGWGWTKVFDKNYNYIDNLIYQNLLVILGEKFLYEWRTYGSTRKDFLGEAKKYIKSISNDNYYFEKLFELLYIILDENDKENINEKLKLQKKELKNMQDRIKFIDDTKNKRMKLTKKIQKIDLALNDKKVLKKEIERINQKLDENKKIKSISTYKKRLLKEKENALAQISYLSSMLIPANFIKRKENLEISTSVYGIKKSLEDAIIDWQIEFFKFLDKKINKITTRDEIVDVIYELRYYQTLKINQDDIISDYEEIDSYIDKILKKAINKLCKLGAIKIISMDIKLNYEIIKYALNTKIIELEKVKLALEIQEDGLLIKIFDKDVFEKQGKKKIKITSQNLEIKEKRKIKLFN